MNLKWAVRRTRRRLIAVAAIPVAAAVLAVTAHVAAARPSSPQAFQWSGGDKPVIVLEHGAWADASSWDKVIARLQGDGFTVYAPPNPLRGLPQDSAYLNAFLTHNLALAGRSIVLVGHSYGGAVITDAATGVAAVKALVYVDAFIPDQGETIGELVAAQPGSCLGGKPADVFNFVPIPGGDGDLDSYIQPSLVPGCFAGGVPQRQAAVIAAVQRPLAVSALSEPSGVPAWKTIPSWAVIGTADQVLPPAEQAFMAQRAGAHVTDVKAGHLSMISDPSKVTRVIEEAAAATS